MESCNIGRELNTSEIIVQEEAIALIDGSHQSSGFCVDFAVFKATFLWIPFLKFVVLQCLG